MAPDITPTTITKTTSLSKAPSLPKRAYVTFLAGDGDYWKGVVGLVKGLRKAKSKYPLLVAMLPDVPEEHRKILIEQGCFLREIEPVYPPENQTQFAMAYYVINYSKLRIWEVSCVFSFYFNFSFFACVTRTYVPFFLFFLSVTNLVTVFAVCGV